MKRKMGEMKRIAIISHGLSDGGAERVASILANYFARQGWRVLFLAVYSSEKEYALCDSVEYKYIPSSHKNRLSKLIDRSIQIDQALRDFQCDVAVSFIINETVVANIRRTTPIVYSLRIDPADIMKKKLNAILCRFCYGRAKAIVFQTKDAREFFSGRILERGVVIGNPLTEGLPFWNEHEHEKSVITACRLTKQKNLEMLIRGFAIFRRTHKEYHLKIFGKGPELGNLQALCKTLRIDKYVSFPGHTKDIHKIMSQAGIFALTSDFEGLSNSMLEALAIGIPTICTDCPPGGAAEYIQDRVNGMLVPVGDVELFASKLSELAENKTLCNKLSNNSVNIRKVLDVDSVMRKWEKTIGLEIVDN